MLFDRAAILREAHAETRRRCAPCHYQRYGDVFDREIGGWVPRASYREVFARKLRDSWSAHKAAAREAAWEAAHPVSAEILAEADAMRAAAWGERITAIGTARMAAQHAAASALVAAACFGAAS